MEILREVVGLGKVLKKRFSETGLSRKGYLIHDYYIDYVTLQLCRKREKLNGFTRISVADVIKYSALLPGNPIEVLAKPHLVERFLETRFVSLGSDGWSVGSQIEMPDFIRRTYDLGQEVFGHFYAVDDLVLKSSMEEANKLLKVADAKLDETLFKGYVARDRSGRVYLKTLTSIHSQ